MDVHYNLHKDFLNDKADSYFERNEQILAKTGACPFCPDRDVMRIYIVLINRKLNELIGLYASANLSKDNGDIILKERVLTEFVVMTAISPVTMIYESETRKGIVSWALKVIELLILNGPWDVKIETLKDNGYQFRMKVKEQDLEELAP